MIEFIIDNIKIISVILQILGTVLMYFCAITPFLEEIKKHGRLVFVFDGGEISKGPTEEEIKKDKKYVHIRLGMVRLGFCFLIIGLILELL
ncbi:MAG: hypothetical protein IJQ90_02720 [Alphaproteobacteria bacterium]|nr:hypothetical protein [Alphaproteobacteria bacterium]